MREDYLRNWNKMTHGMHRQFQALLDLNVKTLQNLNYFRPEDLSRLNQPGEIISKQMALTMENSQKLFDYVQKSFQIMENSLLPLAQDFKESAAQAGELARGISIPIQKTHTVKKAKVKAKAKIKAKSKTTSLEKKAAKTSTKSQVAKSLAKRTAAKPLAKKTVAKSLAKKAIAKPLAKKTIAKSKAKKLSSKSLKSALKSIKSVKPAKPKATTSLSAKRRPTLGAKKANRLPSKKSKPKDKMTALQQKMGLPKVSLLAGTTPSEKKPETSIGRTGNLGRPLVGGHFPHAAQAGKGKNPFAK